MFIQKIQRDFHPEITYLIGSGNQELSELAPFTADYRKQEGKTTIYICENFVCHNPVRNLDEAIDLLTRLYTGPFSCII
ncbi:hypothetical protein D0463_17565 [Bacillus sp. V59.32b]|nr:hypothetical protein D0463_17565 [Bacillus sp. V59.32b]